MDPTISFIILTWTSEKTISACLKSISERCVKEEIEYEILIVDNGSSDNTVRIVREHFRHLPIHLTVLNENKGTTFPRNLALSKSKGDIICILDSDAWFLNGKLCDIFALLKDESVGIVAPKLILPDGFVQGSARKFPSVLSKFLRIPMILFRLKIKDYDLYPNFPFSNETKVDTAFSACWFLRRKLLEEVGLFDEKIFYSPEDVDYCLRVRQKKKKIIYYPHFEVLHHAGKLTHKRPLSKHSISQLWGFTYIFIKHKYLIKPKCRH